MDQNLFGPKIFQTQNFLFTQNFSDPKFSFHPKFFADTKFLFDQIFFEPDISFEFGILTLETRDRANSN